MINEVPLAPVKQATWFSIWAGFLILAGETRAQFFGKEVYHVTSAEEFVEAIGSDRTIRIASTNLILSDVGPRPHRNIRWEDQAMTVHGVKNLRVLGVTEGSSELVVQNDSFVLAFENCRNLDLHNLTIGHERSGGKCSSAVLGFSSCTNILLTSCELYGCGTEGLTLSRVARFEVRSSTIRDCTLGIMSIQHAKNVVFKKCLFLRNGKLYGIEVRHSYDVLITDGIFRGNQVEGDLFEATASGKVVVRGGVLLGNRYRRLRNSSSAIQIEKLAGLETKR